MSEITRIADQLARAFDGPAWHGPSLNETLEGVTATMAAAKPSIAGAHSIWELVLHISSWEDTIARRLRGEQIEDPVEGDFPAAVPVAPTEDAWAETLKAVRMRHAALVEQVKVLSEDQFFRTVADAGQAV